MTTISKRLKEARKAAGYSQERLEPASASARMNQYEKGVHEPGVSTMQQIAAVLNLPAAYFYCEDDETAHLLQHFHCLTKADRKQVVNLAKLLAFCG